jgi:hypothetical protein
MQRRVFLGNLPESLNGIREVPMGMKVSLLALALLSILFSFLIIPGFREFFLDLAKDAVLIGRNYSQTILGGGL